MPDTAQPGKTSRKDHALFAEGHAASSSYRASIIEDAENWYWIGPYYFGGKVVYVDYDARTGRALCECGAESPVLPSTAARKRWHREHKDAIRAEQWHREHPDELGIER